MADEGERISGPALGSIAAGGLLVFAGIKGYSILTTIRDLIQGKTPVSQTQVNAITGQAGSGGAPVSAQTSSSIANDALSYQGHCYSFGGAPGTSGTGCWDCSSFVNWVLGHDLGLPIPGVRAGAYDGSSHGPTTLEYLVWGSAVSRANVAAGDLCVWQTHMGIAISNSQLVAAETPSQGTAVATIDGTTQSLGEILFCRRVPR
jgi:cell wall-associated NlpC family hydrolase